MRIGEGFIEEIKENGLAKVRVSRDSLYVACSACAAADHVKIVAYNYLGADEGDRVRYQVDDSHLISGAFVCFVVPVFLILAAAVLGYFVNSNEVGALIGALIGAAVSAVILRTYDNVLGRIIDTKATIISIVRDDEDEK